MPFKLTDILIESADKHRCMNGRVVGTGTKACVIDLEKRIDDAKANRDGCDMRSDARLHYNGLLKILRRKLRQSLREIGHAK